MSRPQFCFIHASSAGPSPEAQRDQRRRVRHHAAVASASSRRKPKKQPRRYKDSSPILKLPSWKISITDHASGLLKTQEFDTASGKPPTVLDVSSSTTIPTDAFRVSTTPIAPLSSQACEVNDHLLRQADEDILAECQEDSKLSLNSRGGREDAAHRQQKLALVLSRYFRAMNTNPFNSLAIPGSIKASEVVHYHAQIMAPSQAAVYTIFNVTKIFFSSCYFEGLSNDDWLHTGLASVQATFEQLQNPGQKPSRIVLRHLGKAILHLRRRVEQPGATADDSIISTVLFLAIVARAIGDISSHHVHMSHVRTLVASRGGLDNLGHDGITKCQLMQLDCFCALDNTTGTIFAEARQCYNPIYPVHPFSVSLCALISKLPHGFRELALQQKLALDVLEVLSRTAHASRLSSRSGNTMDLSELPQKERFHDFWEACTCLGAPDDPYTGQPKFEKLLVLGVIIYCMHTFSPIRTIAAVYSGSRTKLTSDIRRRRARNKEEKECLLWICMVLLDSWRAADERLLPMGRELLRELKGGWGSWDDVQRVMGRFFWNGEFEGRCRGYWGMGDGLLNINL